MFRRLFVVISIFISSTSYAVRFDKACDPGDTLLVGAVGDVLLHGPLQKQGYAQGFESLWEGIQPFMENADIMYANLEGPAAAGVSKSGKNVKDPGAVFDGSVYSGYPLFNYHPQIITDLKNSGVDLVSTANNHSMDRGILGVQRTIDALEAADLNFMGTRRNAEETSFVTTTTQKGWNVAWISCTYSTNGIPDKQDLVLDCFDGRVSEYIKSLKDSYDAVIVTPHWGNEYQTSASSQQKNYGRQWLEDGATAIIGAHPHVLQPWEQYTTADGRQGFIHYSLGNFVSNQTPTVKQSSVMLFLGLSKKNGKSWVNGVRYLPLYMNRKPYEAVASNFVEKISGDQASSLKFVKNMYGDERIVEPGEQVITNAECF